MANSLHLATMVSVAPLRSFSGVVIGFSWSLVGLDVRAGRTRVLVPDGPIIGDGKTTVRAGRGVV
jgi:hypothetical protein